MAGWKWIVIVIIHVKTPLYFFSKSMCIIVGDWGMFVKKEITAGNTGTDGDKKQNGRKKRENYL